MTSARGVTSWPTNDELEVGELFTLERARLLELLAGLSPSDWMAPTPCPGWSVHWLCNHLLGDDVGWLARHRDGYHGTPSPPLDERDFVIWLDDLQNEWVTAARRMSPRLVIDLLGWTLPQIVETLATQDPGAVTAVVSWAGPDRVPVWLDQLRELSERWIHRQQLLQALGRPSDLRADLAGPVLDGLRWAYPYRLSAARAAEGTTIDVIVSGPVERSWHIVAGDGGWSFADRADTPAVATLEMTTELAWRLLTNNLPANQQEDLQTTGDPGLLAIIRQTRAIIGLPK